MKLSGNDQKNLHIINNTLKSQHGFTVTLDENISRHKLNTIRQQFIEEQRDISYTKDAQNNPEYSQCALVVEATNILLGKSKSDNVIFSEQNNSRVSKLRELEEQVEKLKVSHPEKALTLESKVNKLRDKIYVESKEKELTRLLKEDAQEAEVIMASKNLLDTVQGFQTKIGDLMNKQLDPFIERVRSVYGVDVADKMYSSMESSLNDLMTQTRGSKDVFYNAVGVLTGEGGEMDDSVDNSEIGGEPSLENDDLDLSDEVIQDSSEEDIEVDSGEEESFEDDETPDDDTEDEDFQRKEE